MKKRLTNQPKKNAPNLCNFRSFSSLASLDFDGKILLAKVKNEIKRNKESSLYYIARPFLNVLCAPHRCVILKCKSQLIVFNFHTSFIHSFNLLATFCAIMIKTMFMKLNNWLILENQKKTRAEYLKVKQHTKYYEIKIRKNYFCNSFYSSYRGGITKQQQ